MSGNRSHLPTSANVFACTVKQSKCSVTVDPSRLTFGSNCDWDPLSPQSECPLPYTPGFQLRSIYSLAGSAAVCSGYPAPPGDPPLRRDTKWSRPEIKHQSSVLRVSKASKTCGKRLKTSPICFTQYRFHGDRCPPYYIPVHRKCMRTSHSTAEQTLKCSRAVSRSRYCCACCEVPQILRDPPGIDSWDAHGDTRRSLQGG
eukprot:4658964-Pyramimonas_sp.AAC.1